MSVPGTQTQPSFRISRSPLVWLGLFGLFFIFWSWADSMYRMVGIGRLVEIREIRPPEYPIPPWVTRHMEFYGHQGGCLTASMAIPDSAHDLRIAVVKHQLWNSAYVSTSTTWFPMPGLTKDELWEFPSKASYRSTHLRLPHWIVLGIYLLIWGGAIVWRSRKVARILRHSQDAAP